MTACACVCARVPGVICREIQTGTARESGRQHVHQHGAQHARHLEDTAAVAVRGHVEAVLGNGVVDKLVVV